MSTQLADTGAYFSKSWDLRKFAQEVHSTNVKAGWWGNATEKTIRDSMNTKLMLVLSELSEALEADRKNLGSCKHLPHRESFDTELADALLRTLDIVVASGRNVDTVLPFHRPGMVKAVASMTSKLAVEPVPACLWHVSKAITAETYGLAVAQILAISVLRGVCVVEVAREKMAYNKTRVDHTKEAREGKNGKKY